MSPTNTLPEDTGPSDTPVPKTHRRAALVIEVPTARLAISTRPAQSKVRNESRAARLRVARVQAHRKRAGKPGKPRRAVGTFEYGGELLTLLIAHGCLSEDYPPEGPAFDKALRAAMTKFMAEIVAGKILLTR